MRGNGCFLHLRDTVRESLQLLLVKHLGIDHADQQGFYRALAEPVHDAFDGAAGNTLTRLRGPVKERAVLDRVGQVALLLESPQYSANGRLFQRSAELFANWLRGYGAETPDEGENAALEFAELSRIVTGGSVTCHSVTDCST